MLIWHLCPVGSCYWAPWSLLQTIDWIDKQIKSPWKTVYCVDGRNGRNTYNSPESRSVSVPSYGTNWKAEPMERHSGQKRAIQGRLDRGRAKHWMFCLNTAAMPQTDCFISYWWPEVLCCSLILWCSFTCNDNRRAPIKVHWWVLVVFWGNTLFG